MIAPNIDPQKQLLIRFFKQFPNRQLQAASNLVHKQLVGLKSPMPGKPGGWAGGIVYAISSIGVGVPGVLNGELQESFQVSMATIYKRAAQIRKLLAKTLYPNLMKRTKNPLTH